MMQYAKFLLGVVATVLSAVVAALAQGPLTPVEIVNIAILAVGALGVFTAPNIPGSMYSKAVLGALAAALAVFNTFVAQQGFHVTTGELLQIIIAVLGAFGIAAVPNQPAVSAVFPSAQFGKR